MTQELAIIKNGSSTVENADHIGTDQRKVDFYVVQHTLLRAEGLQTHQVASGAVVEGKEYVQSFGRPFESIDDRELAKLGTAGQIAHWQAAGRKQGIMVDQVLATHKEIDDKAEGTAIIESIRYAAAMGILGVSNENNAAANTEMAVYEEEDSSREEGKVEAGADCDWLAAHMAIATGAKILLLLSNIDGFKMNGRVVRTLRVDDIDENLLAHCQDKSVSGTGGMRSKVLAAKKAAEHGILVVIANAATLDYRELLAGKAVCTRVIQ